MGVLFISHSSKDNDEAIELRDWLRSAGYAETFLDLDPEHGLAPGQRWEEELQKAGERCSGIVILISPEWAASKWCFHEFKFAKALGKKIFPVLVKPTPFDDLPRELYSHYQLADISTPDLKSDGLERLRIGLRRAGLDPKSFIWPPEDEPGRAPYRGLQALTEKDAAVFFGRDHQITAGLDKLRQMRTGAPKRILTIAAASGAGKSSFLKAGLLARLERDRENFIVLPTVRPGRDALSGETGLLQAYGLEAVPLDDAHLSSALNALRGSVLEELRSLAAVAGETHDVPAPTLILPVDQAEELFSTDNTTGTETLDLLKQSLRAIPDLAIILTIRSDSLGTLQADSEIATQLELFNLPALPPESFKEVIEGPAELAKPQIEIAPALTSRLIHDLNRSDALPLLAFTMERLAAEFADDNLLELHEYTDGLGGVSGAINAAVEAAFQRAEADPVLPDTRYELDQLARTAFIPKLVQLDEADASPKRRVSKFSDLADDARPLLRHFVQERLLVQGEADGETVVEVSHEAVLRRWRGLSAWIGEERTMLIGLQRIKRSAEEWGGNEKTLSAHSPDLLVHRGERLAAAEAFFEREDFAKDLEGQPTTYLKACRAAEDAARAKSVEQAERESRQESRGKLWRRLTTAMVFIAALLTCWGLFSTIQGQRNVERTYSQLLTAASQDALQKSQPQLATRLSLLAASDSVFSPAARGAQFQLAHSSLLHGEFSELVAFETNAQFVEVSPSNKELVVFSSNQYDGRAQIWTIDESGTWSASELAGHHRTLTAARFSTGGRYLVTGSRDCDVRIWERTNNEDWMLAALLSDPEVVSKASSIGHNCGPPPTPANSGGFISALGDEMRETFNEVALEMTLGSGVSANLLLEASGHLGDIISVEFSSDSSLVLSASTDGSVRVWNKSSDNEWQTSDILLFDTPVRAHFSPNDQSILIAKMDASEFFFAQQNEYGRWVAEQIAIPNVELTSVDFYGNSNELFATGFLGLAPFFIRRDDQGWLLAELSLADLTALDSFPLFSTDSLSGWAQDVAISDDGQAAVSITGGNEAYLWTRGDQDKWMAIRLLTGDASVQAAVFSKDSRSLAVATSDKRIQLYKINDFGEANWFSFTGHHGQINSLAFSSDGRMLATASRDGTVRVWNVAEETRLSATKINTDVSVTLLRDTNRRPENLESQRASSAVFSQEPSEIFSVSSSLDRGVRWKPSLGDEWSMSEASMISEPVFPVSVSYDQKYRISVTNGNAIISPHKNSNLLSAISLERGDYAFVSASFSPNQMIALTSTADGFLSVWTPNQDETWSKVDIANLGYAFLSASFSPDGSQILGVTFLGELLLWDVGSLLEYRSSLEEQGLFDLFSGIKQIEFACDRMTKSKVWFSDGTESSQAVLDESDFSAVPVLRSLGFEPGMNVCGHDAPDALDRALSRLVPRNWWSELD